MFEYGKIPFGGSLSVENDINGIGNRKTFLRIKLKLNRNITIKNN